MKRWELQGTKIDSTSIFNEKVDGQINENSLRISTLQLQNIEEKETLKLY